MKWWTNQHLTAAERNRDLAAALLDDPRDLPGAYEWLGVMAFYSAVHFVNAYLWEQLSYRPRDHSDRTGWVHRVAALKPIGSSYDVLQDYGWKGRYDPRFRLDADRVRQVYEFDLALIERTIRAALAG